MFPNPDKCILKMVIPSMKQQFKQPSVTKANKMGFFIYVF